MSDKESKNPPTPEEERKTIREGIRKQYEAEAAEKDRAFPPITDMMKVHFVYKDIEFRIKSSIPREMILSGNKTLDEESYVLMPAMINPPPEGQLVLIKADEYIIKSIIGHKAPSENLISEISKKLEKEADLISKCIKMIFNNSKFSEAVFKYGAHALNVSTEIAKTNDIDMRSVNHILFKLEKNFKIKSTSYDLASGFAVQAIIYRGAIYPLLREAKHAERIATRKKIYPKHKFPEFIGQRTEVWPEVKAIYTEIPKVERYQPEEEEENTTDDSGGIAYEDDDGHYMITDDEDM